MAKFSADQYRAFAAAAIQDLVLSEGAAVWDEIEAKVADTPWRTAPQRIDPHHLTTARRALISQADGQIVEHQNPSKGGHIVPTLQPRDQTDRITAIADVAQRKRALHSRYMSWAMGNRGERNRIGPAGELFFHSSLMASTAFGYMPLKPQGGDIPRLLDEPVPGGPVDNAAWLTVPNEVGPPKNYLVVIEVKNVRSWIYPAKEELYQILEKSARLANAHPDVPIIPVLVCRRSSYLVGVMGKDLGFVVLSFDKQPIIWPESDTRLLDEVIAELAYDLLAIPSSFEDVPPSERIVGALKNALPVIAERTATTWEQRGRHLGHLYSLLRAAPMTQRSALVGQLAFESTEFEAEAIGTPGGNWNRWGDQVKGPGATRRDPCYLVGRNVPDCKSILGYLYIPAH